MREYKFRGKEIDTGKWVYGGLFKEPAPPQCFEKTLEDKYWIVYPDPRYMPDWNLPYQMVRTDVEKETIGQYTGLKDRNMKEIYEGDVIKVFTNKEWRIGKIIYEHSGFTIDVTNNKELKYGRTSIIEKLTEVIGNIYDNKNLLEEGEQRWVIM